MIRKIILISTLLTSLFSMSYAQIRCHTMESMEFRFEQDPDLAQQQQAVHQQIFDIVNNQSTNKVSAQDSVYIIPVVVHIVYKASDSANQNLSDARIQSQIDVLNWDYRRLNSDTFKTRTMFKPVAGDARIEFRLANVDPQGNPTTGITRTAHNNFFPFTSFTNDIKSSASGGVDAWPTDEYLNIWVGELFFGLLGYAQFPGDNPTTDGVVIGYEYFGRYISSSNPFNLGRTTTHEVGHWLGLYHIWGDGDCTQDDGIADTPDADGENSGCTLSKNTCGSPDMVENYMDYSDDACMNIFTQGQIDVMRTTLETTRANILSSPGYDGSITSTSIIDRKQLKLELYPNPTSELVNIDMYVPVNGDVSISIYNAGGKEMISRKFESHSNSVQGFLDVQNLEAGVYVLYAEGNEFFAKKKLIIR